MIKHYKSRCLLFLIITISSLSSWIIEPEENYKSRRSLRDWRSSGRLQELYGFKGVWAGKYRPESMVRWIPNEPKEAPVSDVDLCGHSCKEGVAIFGFAVCQVDWKTGCPDSQPPEGKTADVPLYDLCPQECDNADPSKNAEKKNDDDDMGVMDHINVWTVTDGKEKHWDRKKVRIELMPQPNPNIRTDDAKPKRDHKCVCTGCPKPPPKPTIDPKKMAIAKGEEPKKDTENKPKEGDEPEISLSDTTAPPAGTCPQCCYEPFKSAFNHVVFHDLNEEKQDKPEVQVAYGASEEH